jgi:hypothetical protein
MASTNDVHTGPLVEVHRESVRAVLASATFAKNPRLTALLEYLAASYFQGRSAALKEYSIATDVFGRAADFDQSTDAIVRVEMHRLRKKLKDYYANEGINQAFEIVIPNGHYLPEFVDRKAEEQRESAAKLSSEPGNLEPAFLPKGKVQDRSKWLKAGVAGLVCIAALAALSLWFARGSKTPPTIRPATETQIPAAAAPAGETIRILCGSTRGGYRDRDGNDWAADAYFTGGAAVDLGSQRVLRTRDAFLFRGMRTGEFSYHIPLKAGVYEVRLFFADTSYTPGIAMEGGENVRVFNVAMNSQTILRNFDIIAEAGPNTADVKVFRDVRPGSDGMLHLQFFRGQDTPLLNAIEIRPGLAQRLQPIRIVTQDNRLTDRDGIIWSPDNYFLSGRIIARFGTVNGSADPAIYERERYGHFSYAIPVPPGRYSLRLHFAETFWGPKEQGGGGVGSRIFNVFCNGKTLLEGLDMFAEAGTHRQIVKEFHNLTPNAQGVLLLSFVPVVNYANVSAIEVLDEGGRKGDY